MSDDLSSTDIENAIFSLHLLKQALRDDGAHCCPNVPGSQMYHLLRSILYSSATLKEERLLGLVHALFSNQGAEFCKKGVCGVAACTFGSINWEDYDQHEDCMLAKDLAALLEARKDRTMLKDLAAELAHGHRRAVANVIALFKHDHVYSKVLEGSSLYVTALDGHRRFSTVVTSAECATSVTASRFRDFNDLCDSTVDLEKVTQQQTHIVQTLVCTMAPPPPPPPTAKQKKKKADDAEASTTASLFALSPHQLFEAIRTANSDESAGPGAAPGLMFFSASLVPKPVQVLSKYPIVLFRTVPRVEYLPGVSGPESVCGGGVRGMRATIEAAKRGSTYGELYMGGNGQVEGWDQLPTLLEAQRVHSGACGTRPYNAWAGPLALEKAIEFGLPFVDAEGELTMTPHESATHAHHFVAHVAQLTQPRLLVTFAHDGTTAVEVKETHLDPIRDAARALGFALHRSLVEFRGVEAKKRRELVEKAFSMGPGDAWELAMQARVGCEPANRNAASQAALVVRLATLVCPDISQKWPPLLEELERLGTPARFLSEGGATPARRAALILQGHWFDVGVAGEAWPRPGTARSAGPFAAAEDSDVGTLALRLPPGESVVAVGFLRAPAKTATSFSLVLEGHSSVSLTQGHLLVLEEAARHVLKSPSVCVAPASVANGWERVLPPQSSPPSPSPRVFHGTVVQNEQVENRGTPTRRWTGHLKLHCDDGVHELTYHSILIQNAVERKRTVQGGAVHHGEHLFPEAYGLDYTQRGTLAELAEDQEVVVTSYDGAAVHAVLVSGPALGQSPHGKAVVPLYELTTDAAKPRIDGPNGLVSFVAWVVQRLTKCGVAALLAGLQGTGKSFVLKLLNVILGPNTMRMVKRAEQELEKQFGQEFTNTALACCDEVGVKFFKAADGEAMKETLTSDVSKNEVKHVQGQKTTMNNMSWLGCSNERYDKEKFGRRWMIIGCANALRADGVCGQAASAYFKAFDAALRSPYRNAGVLHFLAQYPLVSNLEVYSEAKSKTSAALAETPREFHLRFLVDLCEFPVGTHRLSDYITEVEKGWGEEDVVDRQELKALLAGWHACVCSRRESDNDRLANPATSMLKKLEPLLAGHATLAEMNAGQPLDSFRLSRAHIRSFLREKGYNVRQPPGRAFYEDGPLAGPAIKSVIAAIEECHTQERLDATKVAASIAAWTVLDNVYPAWQKTSYYCGLHTGYFPNTSLQNRAGVLKAMAEDLNKRGTFL